jgi:hypothetical protein
MSSPMPLDAGRCSLCFDHIYEGEHWTDLTGEKWDSHTWCHLMDLAFAARKRAAEKRESHHHPCIED